MASGWINPYFSPVPSRITIPSHIGHGSRKNAAIVAKIARTKHSVNYLLLNHFDFREMDLSGASFVQCSLNNAQFTDANLIFTNFYGCELSGSDLIEGGKRADGYDFFGQMRGGKLWIKAGCRYFPIDKAREHWLHRRGTPLGAETTAILNRIEATAIARGYLKPKSKAKTKKSSTKRKESK